MKRNGGKILIIRGGAIGDFILTLPVLAALRVAFPRTQLEILGYPHIAQLALAGGLAEEARPIEAQALSGFFAPEGVLSPDLREYFAGFAIILSYLYDPDGTFQANVARCSKAQFIAGPHRPDEAAGVHASDALLKPLQRLAIFEADPHPRLHLPAPPPSGIPGRIALHPGSGSEQKNWPEARWAEFLQRLVESTRHQLLLVGGEAEGARLERLARPFPQDRVTIARSLPLVDLAGVLSRCSGFVGHDSGITHLAAALGLGGLVLWGQTNRAVWEPRTARMKILCGPLGLSQLEAGLVIDEFLARFSTGDSLPAG